MKNFKNQKLIFIAVCALAVVICIIICLSIDNNDSKEDYSYLVVNNSQNSNEKKLDEAQQSLPIYIHVAGEVNIPGLIEAEEGDRIKDVIEKAGGLTDLADISKINLAYQVQDGQKVVVPSINDIIDEKSKSTNYIIENSGDDIVQNESNSSSKVNINTASQTELETLSGIGPSIASKIIAYRNENGKFKNIEEIKNVPGVGSSKFESIKDEIIAK